MFHQVRKGYIMLSVIVIIAILAIIMQMFVMNVETAMKQADVLQTDYQSRCLVESGIDKGIALVIKDDANTPASQSEFTDTTSFAPMGGITIYISIDVHRETIDSNNEKKVLYEYGTVTSHLTYNGITYKKTAGIYKHNGKWYIYKWW